MRRASVIGLCCLTACFSEPPQVETGSGSTGGSASATSESGPESSDASTTQDEADGSTSTGFWPTSSSGLSSGSSSGSSSGFFDTTGGIDETCTEEITLLFDMASVDAGLNNLTFPITLDDTQVDYGLFDAENVSVRNANEQRIPHRIDTWREGGESVLWVRAPRIDPMHDRIFVCLGAPSGPMPDVWLPEVVGVWNFGDPGNTGVVPDDSIHAHGATLGTTVKSDPLSVDSPLGRALAFSQPGDYAEVEVTDALGLQESFTLEAVVRRTNGDTDWQTAIQQSASYNLRVHDGSTSSGAEVFFESQSGVSASRPAISQGDDVYLSAVYNAAEPTLTFCVNGDDCSTVVAPGDALSSNKNPLQLGRGDMLLDHIRITAIPRSPAWIEAAGRGFAGTLLLPYRP